MALYSWYKSKRPGDNRTERCLAEDKAVVYSVEEGSGLENVPLIAQPVRNTSRPDMEKVTVPDRNGDQITLNLKAGRLWPMTMEHVADVCGFTARPDDVFLCSYPRSGTHWVSDLLVVLISNRLQLQTALKADAMLEYVGCDHLDTKPSPRVINTHLNYHLLPKDVFQKQCKIVFVYRNPKDVALSYYHFIKERKHYGYNGKFPAFLELFMEGKVPYGDWFEYMQEWNSVIEEGRPCQIHIMYYEQLKQHFLREMSRLCSFLDLTRSTEFLEEMEKLSSFDSFKRSVDAQFDNSALDEWKGAPQFIRTGVVGDWKNWFTVALNEEFDELYQRRMKGSCFNFSYETDFTESV
ncbi:sulfotransferase 1E1-like [Liolophura sinensis]|uniref:sulfotransferase 1E1-like n=1 Tax=Liolophura sinensis TaxID=3198878 RepID=UPI0031587096